MIAIPGSRIPGCWPFSPVPGFCIGEYPNPGISGLQKMVIVLLFQVLNDTDNNSSRLMNKTFRVLEFYSLL